MFKQIDDLGNAFWTEYELPLIGSAMTIFVKQVNIIKEDYFYFMGAGLFGGNTPG